MAADYRKRLRAERLIALWRRSLSVGVFGSAVRDRRYKNGESFVAIAARRNTHCAVKNAERTKVAVVGASGYTGEELVRLLLRHPSAELAAITSRQFAGRTLAEIFPRLAHRANAKTLRFSDAQPAQLAELAQIIFLALPHG